MEINNILAHAVETGDKKRYDYAICQGCNVNAAVSAINMQQASSWQREGFTTITPLALAIMQNNTEMLEYLLRDGADLTQPIKTDQITYTNALALATIRASHQTYERIFKESNQEMIAKAAIEFKKEEIPVAHVLVCGYIPELTSAESTARLGQYLDRGLEVEQKDRHGYNLMMNAARVGNLDAIILLVQHGGDLTEKYPDKEKTIRDFIINADGTLYWQKHENEQDRQKIEQIEQIYQNRQQAKATRNSPVQTAIKATRHTR
ncbi:ankyrin repeat domain-containing protein [bacterium]|nr:ankyrin repeat domain-containing protein [bacterium]MBR2273321.1 ankyrin repeat domain-containing protein [Alphaproteobacteria bacterium]